MTTSIYPFEAAFGVGVLTAQRNDVSTSTPVQFGTLQNFSLDYSSDLKELYGRNRYAIALAPGKTKVSGKAQFVEINANLYNSLYFGATLTVGAGSGSMRVAYGEQQMVPATAPYTVTCANSGVIDDQGVTYQSTGLALVLVASAPISGQYSVNQATGVYTFSAGDAGAGVNLTYVYTSTVPAGKLISINNPIMGSGPAFSLVFNEPFDGRQATWTLNNCKSSKLTLPSKQDDWLMQDIEFMVSADQYGNIGTISTQV